MFDFGKQAIEVICLCGTDGKLTPLRFRYQDRDDFLRTAKILEVVDIKKIEHVGVERFLYLCKTQIDNGPEAGDCLHMMELVYTIRPHRWMLTKTLY